MKGWALLAKPTLFMHKAAVYRKVANLFGLCYNMLSIIVFFMPNMCTDTEGGNGMFCKNCGKELVDNINFCPACGEKLLVAETAPVEETAPAAEAIPMTEPAPVAAPVKKKSKKGWIIAGVSVATVAALVLVCIFTPLKDVITNAFAGDKRVGNTYEDAAGNETKPTTADEEDKPLDGTVSIPTIELATAYSGTMELEVSSDLLAMIPDAPEAIKDFNKVALDYSVEWDKDSQLGCSLTAKVKGAELATMNMYLDMVAGEMVMTVPGILTKPVKMDLTEITESDNAEVLAFYEQLGKLDWNALPSDVTLRKILNNVLSAALAQVKDVEKSDTTLTVNGVSQQATCTKSTITAQTAANMMKAVLQVLQKDADIKKAIVDFCDANAFLFDGMSGAEIYEEVSNALNEVATELNDASPSSEEAIVIKTWTDAAGVLLALEMDVDGNVVFFGSATDGDKVGYDLYLQDGNVYPARIMGSGTKTNGKLNAAFSIIANGEEMLQLIIDNLDVKQLEKGYIDGQFTLAPGKAMVADIPQAANLALRFAVKTADKSSNIVLDVLMNGTSLATLRMTSQSGKAGDVVMPGNAVVIDELDESMIDMAGLMERLEKTGLMALIQSIYTASDTDRDMVADDFDMDYDELDYAA